MIFFEENPYKTNFYSKTLKIIKNEFDSQLF